MSYCPSCNDNISCTQRQEIKTREIKEPIEKDSHGNILRYRIYQEEYVYRTFYTCDACSNDIAFPQAENREQFLSLTKDEAILWNVHLPIGALLLIIGFILTKQFVWDFTSGWGAFFLVPMALFMPLASFLYIFNKLSYRHQNIIAGLSSAVKTFLLIFIFVSIASVICGFISNIWFSKKTVEIIVVVLFCLGFLFSLYCSITEGIEQFKLLSLIDDELDQYLKERVRYYKERRAQEEQEQQAQGSSNTQSERAEFIQKSFEFFDLGIDATKDDLKKAYRNFMKENHPDKISSIKGVQQQHIKAAEEKCKLANELNDVLNQYLASK